MLNEFGKLLWTPSQETIQKSRITDYMHWVTAQYNDYLKDYNALYQWSIEDIGRFWESIAEYFEVKFHTPYDVVINDLPMPYTQWFRGATLNYAEQIFANSYGNEVAIYHQSEHRPLAEINWKDLRMQVASFSYFLKTKGVEKGDRVVGFLPNIPEATIAFLACCSMGVIWSSCSPDFGADSVIDRFRQISPKVFVTTDGYYYNGKQFSKWEASSQIANEINSIENVVYVNFIGCPINQEFKVPLIEWKETMTNTTAPLIFEAVPFYHPIWILYSSGTTVIPKAITHSQGGALLEHLKYLCLQNDVHPGEKFFWYSTTGWMMWNFTNAALLSGGSIVLYEGSPAYPDMNVLWQLAETTGINHFGTSAPYIISCMKRELSPGKQFDLSSLRSIGSTGSPLPPEAFGWVYEHIKKDVWLTSMSGGTDVCTAFVGGCPILPVYQGEIQCMALGCDLHAYEEEGRNVKDEVGEMVIIKAMPCMPVYMWNDPDYTRYLDSYFEMYPNIWRHGDWIKITPRNTIIIYGRSDATLNRHGVRIGTSEIYSAVNTVDEVKDSLILNLELAGGKHFMPLFIILEPNVIFDNKLKDKINNALRNQYSNRHVPDEIFLVDDIPYTISGKKMEAPIKKILMGIHPDKAVKLDAMRNPESIDYFLNMAREKKFI
ncbi:MAG TPA: acetoacetate--CoA ligase [Saprospiraceae bacterium]|nr:acetoacetate--CoA ligase [Saprospiraceae bacterium]